MRQPVPETWSGGHQENPERESGEALSAKCTLRTMGILSHMSEDETYGQSMMEGQPQLLQFLGSTAIIASDEMRRLMATIERVAQSGACVLIRGESGSGKEVVARAIHHYSLRSSKPWVDVSCAALPEHLVESELFGYERGAFSGAGSLKPGLFELAHTGTIFLDEIGELDPRMQVKLLRVLDGATYYRLGGTRKVAVDVRVIAATNCDLEQAVDQGYFRSDLYYRLNQIDVHVPALRDRVDDVLPLADYFLQQTNRRPRLSPEAARRLCAHHWPGNVRELRNVMIKAAMAAGESEIEVHHLPAYMTPARPRPAPVAGDLDSVERAAILNALEKSGGHQQRAADLLGISRRTLSRRLKTYAGSGETRYAC